MSEQARQAALRVGSALVRAKEGGYYELGWYSYIDRVDVELLVKAVLEPTEVGLYERLVREGNHVRPAQEVEGV